MRTASLLRHSTLICGGLPVVLAVLLCGTGTGWSSSQPPAHLKEHVITIDATKLVPASWWQVPGVTPSIWASDPESLDAPKTSERRDLQLKPGPYKFISFTFDFPFTVTLNGTLEFATSLDQCIDGRGTHTLVVRCKRMYPHGGERDNYYNQQP
ncbi:MAG: hypothetical protein FJ244_02470 [Nitrospira sp.]|nr:hypothetical protein [Nitrospira sp.]